MALMPFSNTGGVVINDLDLYSEKEEDASAAEVSSKKYEEYDWNWSEHLDEKNMTEQADTAAMKEHNDNVSEDENLPIAEAKKALPVVKESLIFKRIKLSGGIVVDQNGNQVDYLNESIIRHMNLDHNDKLRVRRIKEDGRKEYDIIGKVGEINPERIVAQYCIANLDPEGNRYLINTQIVGGEKQLFSLPEGEMYQFQFKMEDVKHLNLEDGSIVDLAFWKGRPDTARIIWKHSYGQKV
ncbi:hypothetical protein G5B47_12635 [Paenibacillus sp. 7124]|uniref:Uncharacterized protein n=1 Tax=Paenibacillus apii TaxID=1850370 RepID=A0A6M1PLN6_9BACL|nr:hypothetical protein [Paenibacillus apii]NGM83262.1 hypothetical protein [Paenibacillus apii]NJJ38910.1 hypothetical protein [Paenibacillus apii]